MKNSIQIKAADTLKAAHGYSASVVRLRNTSAVSIDYSVSGGSAVELAAGASAVVDVAGLTSEIAVRRTDLSATPANVLIEFGLTADEAYEQSAAAAAAAVGGHDRNAGAHGGVRFNSSYYSGQSLDPNRPVYCQKYFGSCGSLHLLSPLGSGEYFEAVLGAPTGYPVGVVGLAISRMATETRYAACTNTGTWIPGTDADVRGGAYGYTSTAGSSVSATITGDTLGCWVYSTTNGGDALVTIDGSPTAADMLPAVTQAMIDAGRFAQANLGHRFFSCYSNVVSKDRWIPFSASLTAGAHEVVVTATGGPSAGRRLYFSAFGRSVVANTPLTSGASPVQIARLFWPVGNGTTESASELLPVLKLASAGDYVGGIHGAEATTSFTAYKDGTLWEPAAGVTASGEDFKFVRVSTVTVSAEKKADRTLTIHLNGILGRVTVADRWVFAATDIASNCYSCMLPSCVIPYNGETGYESGFASVAASSGEVTPAKDGVIKLYNNSQALAWHLGVRSIVAEVAKIRSILFPWEPVVFFDDRTSGLAKAYLCASPRNVKVPISSGDVWESAYTLGATNS